MKVYITYKRLPSDTVNGEQLQVITHYTSFDKTEIDEIEAWAKENIGEGRILEGEMLKEVQE